MVSLQGTAGFQFCNAAKTHGGAEHPDTRKKTVQFATPIASLIATLIATPIATPFAAPFAMPIATFPVGTPYMVSAQLALGVFDEAHDMAVHSVMTTSHHNSCMKYTFSMAISLEGRNG
ncbi:MAG: hypothetical protein RSA55_08550 [Clostridia bacterium]